ncbi:MAG: DUF2934 domain-containing protein [Paracoccus hibiscisoli]|uniref:DUF2934 domain-containing protein n=1 Tax=Paracoccus hibiscisoli TaxID=2023261 RepID=UPI00391D3E39
MSDTNRDDLIRARAHQIWEDEGRPEGQEADHWTRAAAELDATEGTSVPKDSERDMAPELSAGHDRADEEGSVPPNVAGPKGRKRNKA